jgi:hypothetical protein
MVKRITSRAREAILYGSFVKIEGEECFPEPTLDIGGIAVRPITAVDDRGYRAGGEVIVQTDGPILAEFGAGSVWVNLQNGRIV